MVGLKLDIRVVDLLYDHDGLHQGNLMQTSASSPFILIFCLYTCACITVWAEL